MEAAAEQAEKEFGQIDVWVNNAMNSVFAPFKEITPDEFKRVAEVTYLGQVYGTMSALKRMIPGNKGSIVLVGSALGLQGYGASSQHAFLSEMQHMATPVLVILALFRAIN